MRPPDSSVVTRAGTRHSVDLCAIVKAMVCCAKEALEMEVQTEAATEEAEEAGWEKEATDDGGEKDGRSCS